VQELFADDLHHVYDSKTDAYHHSEDQLPGLWKYVNFPCWDFGRAASWSRSSVYDDI